MSAQKEAQQQPTRAQTLRWDIFKGIVALILLIILILLLLRGCGTLGLFSPQGTEVPITPPATNTPLAGSQGMPTETHAVPEILSPADGAEIASTTITLEGTGDVGSTLNVLDGDEVIDSAVVGDDGRFSSELTPGLGDHVYTVRDANSGLVSTPVTVTITAAAAANPTATTPPVAAQPTSPSGEGDECDYTGVVIRGYKPDKFHYVVGTCDTMSSIAAALGIKLSDLIAANPQIENPDLIYTGQVLNLP